MKGLTISRKLLLIFLVNVIVIGCIAGIVFYSFKGLTGSINYSSSTLGDYKVELDSLRAGQNQLEALTQPFYAIDGNCNLHLTTVIQTLGKRFRK